MNRWRTASPNAVGLLLAVAASWLMACTASPEEPAGTAAPGTATVSPAPPVQRLALDLRRVEGKRVSGRRVRPARLRPAAQAVTRVMTEMYSTGFVDPDAWDDGRFPTLDRLFSLRTRPRVHRDLADADDRWSRSRDRLGPPRTLDDRRAVPRRSTTVHRGRIGPLPGHGDRRRRRTTRPALGLVHAAPRWTTAGRSRRTTSGAASHHCAICTRRSAGPPPRPVSRPPGRSSSW